ncbi:hypothetical protein RBB50_009820 [Rhinocladiella similis]
MSDTDRAIVLFLTAVGIFFTALIWNLYIQFGWERDGVGQLDKRATGAMEFDRLAGRRSKPSRGLSRASGAVFSAAPKIDQAA